MSELATAAKFERTVASYSLFPTRIYQAPLSFVKGLEPRRANRLRKELERDALVIREIDEDGHIWSETNYRGGFTSYGSLDTLHAQFPPFGELEKYLDRHVLKFAKLQNWDLQGGGLKMVSCWVNIMPAGAAHSLHLHPLAVVSGTFYVSTPKGTSPIKFEDPRLDKFMAQPPRHPRAPRTEQPFFEIQPKTGDVVLFESWLRHEVPTVPLEAKQERISISFNYDWV